MTIGTFLVVAEPVNPELLFLAARRVIGIPAEHPFTVDVDADCNGNTRIMSEPGGFDSMLFVYHHDGAAHVADPESKAPEHHAWVSLDTATAAVTRHGDACETHKAITAELGAWLDGQGLTWWTCDEYSNHTWRERTPAYS